MELVADVLDNLLHRATTDLALRDFAGASVDDFVPLRLGISVHGAVEAGDELLGEERPVLFRQGQHFGYFLSGNAHAARISPFTGVLASLRKETKAWRRPCRSTPPGNCRTKCQGGSQIGQLQHFRHAHPMVGGDVAQNALNGAG